MISEKEKQKVIKNIKNLINCPYDERNLPVFIKTLSETVDHFIIGSTYIDQFERQTDQFQRMTKYHMTAMNGANTKYRQRYYTMALMGEEAEDLSVFDVENLGPELVEELKHTNGTIQYEPEI